MKVLIVLAVLCASHYTLADQIDVATCSDVTNEYLNNIDLAITPNPIEIKPGKTISLHFGVDVLKDVAVGATLELKLHAGLLPIPCLDIGLPVPIGSCKYDVQTLLDFLASDPNFDCDAYFPGNGCSLPLLAGHYGGVFHGDDVVVIELPEDLVIPDILKPFINGKIKIEVHIDAEGAEIVCAKTELHVEC